MRRPRSTIAPSPPASAATRSTAPSTIVTSHEPRKNSHGFAHARSRRRPDQFVIGGSLDASVRNRPGRRCSDESREDLRGRRTRQAPRAVATNVPGRRQSRGFGRASPHRPLRRRARPTSARPARRDVGRLVDRSRRDGLSDVLTGADDEQNVRPGGQREIEDCCSDLHAIVLLEMERFDENECQAGQHQQDSAEQRRVPFGKCSEPFAQ